jgi:acyl carrier protein
LILSHVEQQVKKLLSLAPANHLEPNKPLNELGLDSLMAVELRNSLSATIGIHLPTTFLFEYPTIEAITAYLADRLLVQQEKAPKPPTKKDPTFEAAQLDALSEEQLAALLEEKLAVIEAVEFR